MTSFWKPSVAIDRGVDNNNPILIDGKRKNISLGQQRQLLPIKQYREKIIYAMEKYSTIVLVGETGNNLRSKFP